MEYVDSCKVEEQSREILKPFIISVSDSYQWIKDKYQQQTIGDLIIIKDNERYNIELKAELEDKYGRFFLETWSNLDFDRRNTGWMIKSSCDYLWYHFIKEETLYSIDFRKLWRWAFIEHNIYNYSIRPQNKYSQKNKTYGRCVPIQDIANAIAIKTINISNFKKKAPTYRKILKIYAYIAGRMAHNAV